ncbi:propanediol utilization protein [Paenibacillus selenitireducens]|uniref:Phosphate propanoyltransferase n=1 Tax=Paenibacillus selenitireducens TaxID=1324314 RepID=A0A1T2XKR8_9BACL|nr:phosphate propanoyltransferase [Paenibacillus selenitireducens]OPA80273.1 propanediol utilization protein [Paenibacillus selenitireducens]
MGIVTETRLRAMLAKGIPNPFILQAEEKLTPAAADFLKSRGIRIETSVKSSGRTLNAPSVYPLIPVGVSNRHVHLSRAHVECLFGPGYTLTPDRALSQPGQYAAIETVTLQGPRGEIQRVRVLGPSRAETQVEISRTDGYLLGIHAPVRLSGNVAGTPGAVLVGPQGTLELSHGVIVAECHVHMSILDAAHFQVQNGDTIVVETPSDRSRRILFPQVIVRVHERYSLDFHIDLDEANAAGLRTGDFVERIAFQDQFS